MAHCRVDLGLQKQSRPGIVAETQALRSWHMSTMYQTLNARSIPLHRGTCCRQASQLQSRGTFSANQSGLHGSQHSLQHVSAHRNLIAHTHNQLHWHLLFEELFRSTLDLQLSARAGKAELARHEDEQGRLAPRVPLRGQGATLQSLMSSVLHHACLSCCLAVTLIQGLT